MFLKTLLIHKFFFTVTESTSAAAGAGARVARQSAKPKVFGSNSTVRGFCDSTTTHSLLQPSIISVKKSQSHCSLYFSCWLFFYIEICHQVVFLTFPVVSSSNCPRMLLLFGRILSPKTQKLKIKKWLYFQNENNLDF